MDLNIIKENLEKNYNRLSVSKITSLENIQVYNSFEIF